MLKKISSIVLLLSSFGFVACEKEITLDLPETDQQVVLEGSVPLGQNPTLSVTKTLDFYSASDIERVSGVVASVTDQNGNNFELTEVSPGEYTNTSLTGEAGQVYTMNVAYDGRTYQATSTLYSPVQIDELELEKAPEVAGREGYNMTIKFDDDDDNELYFLAQVLHRKDNKREVEDRVSKNGDIHFNARFEEGGEVFVTVHTVDEDVFDYYNGLLDIVDGGNFIFSSEPSNPKSNWSGGALGFFRAFSSDSSSIVIPN